MLVDQIMVICSDIPPNLSLSKKFATLGRTCHLFYFIENIDFSCHKLLVRAIQVRPIQNSYFLKIRSEDLSVQLVFRKSFRIVNYFPYFQKSKKVGRTLWGINICMFCLMVF